MTNENIKLLKKTRWQCAGFFSLIIIAFALWYYFGLQSRLDRIEEITNETYWVNHNFVRDTEEIEELFVPTSDSLTAYNPKDVASIKKKLASLKINVDRAIQLSHQDVINIVDRVNLYVTIGIVLLTLVGGFLPVIVQNFLREEMKEKHEGLKQDLKDKTDEFKNDIGESETQLKNEQNKLDNEMKTLLNMVADERKNMDTIKRTLNNAETKMDEMDQKIKTTEKEIVTIPPLSLAYSLSRALDKDLIRWYVKSPEDTRDFLKSIFDTIANDLDRCKGMDIELTSDILIRSLKDFRFSLKIFIFNFQAGRQDLGNFQNLQDKLGLFIDNGKPEEAEGLFDDVIAEVRNIVNILSVKIDTGRK